MCESASSTPIPCGKGYFAPIGSANCSVCPSGSFCPLDILEMPLPCSMGTYTNDIGGISCEVCPPSFSCPNTSSLPQPCGKGQYSLEGDVVCLTCLLYTSPSPRDATLSRMPSSA